MLGRYECGVSMFLGPKKATNLINNNILVTNLSNVTLFGKVPIKVKVKI